LAIHRAVTGESKGIAVQQQAGLQGAPEGGARRDIRVAGEPDMSRWRLPSSGGTLEG
jgi:hypothetical protein